MNSIQQQIKRSVARQHSDVVFCQDVLRFGSSARVDVALAHMVQAGSLYRIGRGVYAKTQKLTRGALCPRSPSGHYREKP